MATEAQKQPNIVLYRGFKETPNHVWSPYVVKLEARLRFAGVKYNLAMGSPKTAPKGKIPYLECDDLSSSPSKRTSLSDSTIIIDTFTKWELVPDLNSALTPSERAHDLALMALLEEKLYFYHGQERWVQNYYTMRDHVMAPIPYPLRVVIGLLAYRSQVATLYGQGTGRHSDEEIAKFRLDIWTAFNDLLVASQGKQDKGETKPFWVLGGATPSEADCCLFGFIVSVLSCEAAPDSQKVVKSFPALLDYAGRIHAEYFSDYEKWAE